MMMMVKMMDAVYHDGDEDYVEEDYGYYCDDDAYEDAVDEDKSCRHFLGT